MRKIEIKIPIDVFKTSLDTRKRSLLKKGIKRIEEVGASYYRKKGYKVYSTWLWQHRYKLINILRKEKEDFVNINSSTLIKAIDQTGRFDLFCRKSKQQWFFSEVKKIPSDKPQYHENQIKWIRRNHPKLKGHLRFIFINPKFWYLK